MDKDKWTRHEKSFRRKSSRFVQGIDSPAMKSLLQKWKTPTPQSGFDQSIAIKRGLSLYMVFLAILSVLFSLMQLQLCYAHDAFTADEVEQNPSTQKWLLGLRAILSILTIKLLMLSYKFYQEKHTYLRLRKMVPAHSTLWTSHLRKAIIVELIFISIHPFPAIEYTLKQPAFLIIFVSFMVFCRVAFLYRFHYYTNPRHSQSDCLLVPIVNIEYDGAVMMKTRLDKHPILITTFFSVLVILTGAYSLTIIENTMCKYYEEDLPGCKQLGFYDTTWMILLAITTIGYGDVSVKSIGGRSIVVMAGTIGYGLNAIIFSSSLKFMQLTLHEGQVLAFVTRGILRRETPQKAADVLQAQWKAYSSYIRSTEWVRCTRGFKGFYYRRVSLRFGPTLTLRENMIAFRRVQQAQRQLLIDSNPELKLERTAEAVAVDIQNILDKLVKHQERQERQKQYLAIEARNHELGAYFAQEMDQVDAQLLSLRQGAGSETSSKVGTS